MNKQIAATTLGNVATLYCVRTKSHQTRNGNRVIQFKVFMMLDAMPESITRDCAFLTGVKLVDNLDGFAISMQGSGSDVAVELAHAIGRALNQHAPKVQWI